MAEPQVGRDVVLKEKEAQSRLLQLLPTKAQLGFSSLKEHFLQKSDKGVKRFLQSSKPQDAIKLEYTCIDATEEFIALGCNFGILFFYDRKLGRLQRFVSESKQVPIVCVKILPSQNFVVTGQMNGVLTIFNYGKEKDGNYKVLLKCTVDDHHHAPVTCVEWTPDGTKLFSGDSEGNVAISVINIHDGQTHTVFICKEDCTVTQLALCQAALVVSTLRRSLIWPFNLKTPVQVGQQERKIQGKFGACFFPQQQNASPSIYAARPGLRIWRANIEGKVSATMIFKDSIAKGEPEINTLNLASSCSESLAQTEPKQFGPLMVFSDNYLVSWQGPCMWVLDPNQGVVVGCHSNLGCIVGVAVSNEELFVLTKGDENFVRSITFENRAQSPIIEVKTLDLKENGEFIEKIPRAGSVNQFEENDKIDKIIGDMMSSTVGFISGVKRNVVKTIEQIKTKDESDESTTSSAGESPDSMRASSPITIVRRQDFNGTPAKSESDAELHPLVASPCVVISSPNTEFSQNESSNCLPNDDNVNQERSENVALNYQETKQSMDDINADDKAVSVLVKHDMREKPLPFHHISEKDFNTDIVFEGTSKRKPRKKRRLGLEPEQLKETQSEEEEKISCEKPSAAADDAERTTEASKPKYEVMQVSGLEFQRREDVKGADFSVSTEVENAENVTESSDRKVEAPCGLDEQRITNEGDDVEVLRKNEIVKEEETSNCVSETLALTGIEKPIVDKTVEKVAEVKDNGMDVLDALREDIENTDNGICDTGKLDDNVSEEPGKLSEITSMTPVDSGSINNLSTKNEFETTSEARIEGCFDDRRGIVKDPLSLDLVTSEVNRENKEDSIFDPSEVLNVEIATQEPIKNSQVSEPCKTVYGEALERTRVRPDSSEFLYFGETNSNDSDDSWLGDEHGKIELDDSPPRSPVSSEPSLFPAPQMNYHSIYSQETVSLSEVSFSEPEHDVPSYASKIRERDDNLIDSLAMLSIDSDEMTDIEDNRCHSPPINLDQDGGVELTEALFLQHKHGIGSARDSVRGSDCSSPSIFEIDSPLPASPHTVAEKVSERLRLLADSWADIPVPSCGSAQSVTVTDTLIWCVDNHEHLFVTAASSAVVVWKRVDGRARKIAANQSGTIIWGVNRKKVASYRTNVKPFNPQGNDWEVVESEVLDVTVEDTSVWGIRTNGDIFVCTGVSPEKPNGTGRKTIRAASDLVQITCLGSMVWGLDIYNHVQIYQGDLSCLGGNEQSAQWLELPGITASNVALGPKGVCWIIDRDGKVWFNLELSEHNFFGGKWYQLSVGEYLVQDPTIFSTVVSFFTKGDEPKILSGNDISGIWILSKHGSLHAARGHLLGTRWELTVPIAMATSTFWTCVSAQGATGNGGFIWALQPNGDLHCFRPESKSFVVQPPPRAMLKFISASPRSLWALTNNQDVYMRKGISETAPHGLKWMHVDMSTMGNERICSIACGIVVVWAVDFHGNVWFQMGKEDSRKAVFSPAWIQVEGSPFDGCRFTKVTVGSNDCRVWAVDDRNNVYARRDVTESFLIGTAWEVVAGTGAKDISVSDNLVWALCPNGNIVCRFGISSINFVGDYWKTVPGCFEHISVTADDELWGIDRNGQLYKRDTVHFFGTQSTRKVPSYSQLFPTDDDWELI